MKALCRIRDIQRALEEYESFFLKTTGVTLKEGMLLCSLSDGCSTATEIASKIELSCSNCSKILASVERKGYIFRQLGDEDKRNIFFSLTDVGKSKLLSIENSMPKVPELLA